MNDDFALVRVLQPGRYDLVGTLENSFNDGSLDVDYPGGNRLDGNVSLLLFLRF